MQVRVRLRGASLPAAVLALAAAGAGDVLDRTYSEHLKLAGDSAFGYPADSVRIHEPGRTVWLKLNLKS